MTRALLSFIATLLLACGAPPGEGEGEGEGEGDGEGEGEIASCDDCVAPLVCIVSSESDDTGACVPTFACGEPAGLGQTCATTGDPCGGGGRACVDGLVCVVDPRGDLDYPTSLCMGACDVTDPASCPGGTTCAFESPDTGGGTYCTDTYDVAPTCSSFSQPERACLDGSRCDAEVGVCPGEVASCADCTAPQVCVTTQRYDGAACEPHYACADAGSERALCGQSDNACQLFDRACADGLACVPSSVYALGENAECHAPCDPTDADACGAGALCAYVDDAAYCFPEGAVYFACSDFGLPEEACPDGSRCDPALGACP